MKNLTLTQKIVFAFLIGFGLFFFALYTKPQWQTLIKSRTEFVPLSVEDLQNLFSKKDKDKISFLGTKGLEEIESDLSFLDFNNIETILSSMTSEYVFTNMDSTYHISIGVFPMKNIKTLTIAFKDEDLYNKYLKDFKVNGFGFDESRRKNNTLKNYSAKKESASTGFFLLQTMKLEKYYTLTLFNAPAKLDTNIEQKNENASLSSSTIESFEDEESENLIYYSEDGEIVVIHLSGDCINIEFPDLGFIKKLKLEQEATEAEGMAVYIGTFVYKGEHCKLDVQFLEDERCSISSVCEDLDKGICIANNRRKQKNPFGVSDSNE